jgi:hypothetical protein
MRIVRRLGKRNNRISKTAVRNVEKKQEHYFKREGVKLVPLETPEGIVIGEIQGLNLIGIFNPKTRKRLRLKKEHLDAFQEMIRLNLFD